ncbi:shikimate dehydrogenase [Lactobacillus curvatus]|nr:shikimate dehydrogenase [Latilactobacillus curvatus]MSE23178.1 shikimate dehydrogenase [Latilactobacillus curvatus]
MISGYTALYGLVAHPAHHSLSPIIHNMGFKQHQIDARYLVFDSQAQPQNIATAIRTLGVAGVNLSMPYKQSLVPLMDELMPAAQLVGAINTVALQSGELVGTNTDGDGFWRALQKKYPTLANQQIVMLGAGGAGLAIIEAATRYGVAAIQVFKRQNTTYAAVEQRLVTIANHHSMSIVLHDYADEQALQQALSNADCVINATNIGMVNTPGLPMATPLIGQIPITCLVADLIYAPRQTAFLQLAAQSGHPTQNGLGMLIEQAALSFEFWTGRVLQTDPIYHALMKEF